MGGSAAALLLPWAGGPQRWGPAGVRWHTVEAVSRVL